MTMAVEGTRDIRVVTTDTDNGQRTTCRGSLRPIKKRAHARINERDTTDYLAEVFPLMAFNNFSVEDTSAFDFFPSSIARRAVCSAFSSDPVL